MKLAKWDKNQSRELLGLFICVCTALCTIVAQNTVHNRPNNFPFYPPDNHHCSADVYLREGGKMVSATGYLNIQINEQSSLQSLLMAKYSLGTVRFSMWTWWIIWRKSFLSKQIFVKVLQQVRVTFYEFLLRSDTVAHFCATFVLIMWRNADSDSVSLIQIWVAFKMIKMSHKLVIHIVNFSTNNL